MTWVWQSSPTSPVHSQPGKQVFGSFLSGTDVGWEGIGVGIVVHIYCISNAMSICANEHMLIQIIFPYGAANTDSHRS